MEKTMPVHHISLDEVDSTNTYARSLAVQETDEWTVVTAEFQRAGRGAGSNTWESERGQNLLFSIVLHPATLEAAHAFALSEALSLAISDALCSYVEDIHIKWPNDIYCGNCKMAGILIENDLTGQHVTRSILGAGVNVNQQHFTGGAPNPVSLRQLLGHEVGRDTLLHRILCHFRRYCDMAVTSRRDELHNLYVARLYRLGCEGDYRDVAGDFRATLTDVEPDGHLLLRDTAGEQRRYAFKEVAFLPDLRTRARAHNI